MGQPESKFDDQDDYNTIIENEVSQNLHKFQNSNSNSNPNSNPNPNQNSNRNPEITNTNFTAQNEFDEYKRIKQTKLEQPNLKPIGISQNPYVLKQPQRQTVQQKQEQQQKLKEQQQKQELKRLYQQEIKKQSIFTKQELSAMKIFKLDENFTQKQLKEEYRALALQTHPDKGGDPKLFLIITKAYARLLKNIKKRTKQQDFFELKSESKQFSEQNPIRKNPKMNTEFGFNVNRFNQIYKDNKLDDEENEGYEKWIIDNQPEDSTDPPKIFDKYNKKTFHNRFQQEKDKQQGTEIIKWEQPKPMQISNKLRFTELGGKKPNSFGMRVNINNDGGVVYTDFKEAHSNSMLINPKIVKKRTMFRDVQDIEENRSKISYKLSEEDKKYYDKKEKLEKLRELQRLQRLQKKDVQIEEHFHKINKLMLGN